MNLVSPPALWHCLEPRHPLWHMIATMLVLVLNWFLTRRFCAFFSQFFIDAKRNSRLCCCLCGTLFLCIQCYKILFDNNMLWDFFPRKCAAKPLELFFNVDMFKSNALDGPKLTLELHHELLINIIFHTHLL